MRSSIACARCRRSKIKCVNAGIDTTCRACESSGRDCVYPPPATGAAKRDIAALEGDDRNGDWDSPKRQRSRKANSSTKDPAKAMHEVLDASILTPKVWETVFDLFQSHFATLLPFLHPASFLNHIRLLSPHSADSDQSRRPDPLIPLGVLALTARYHPQLIAYHSPSSLGNPSNALVASEFYATALRSRLAAVDSASVTAPDITRIQALLMLALHEWGMCRGKNAWLFVGMAIRLSQAIGLPYELESDRAGDPFGIPRSDPKEQTSDDVIAQETKRRTFWACFTLDRCLSSGKYRPRMIRVKNLGIQLPSDNAFAFGERVRTARLNEPLARRTQSFGQGVQIPSIRQSLGFDDKLPPNGTPDAKSWSPISLRKDSSEDEIDRWEIGAEESVLGRVIRIIRHWGGVAKWSCAGGRRNEQFPPWHLDSRFSKLRMMLGEFQDGLSRNLQYSPRNTETHIMYKNTLAPFTVMHVVYFLSVIVLHRAYIPFLPLRCSEPVGPLDDPIYAADKAGTPEGFWRDSARELFRAARQMIDLAINCQDRGALVENPLTGFAIYNAAFMGVYATHFPHMDQEGVLSSKPGSDNQIYTRKALDIVREMRPRLKMASTWFRTLNRLHSYFSKVKRDFRRHSHSLDLSNGIRPLWSVGGPEDFKFLEKVFFDYGTIEDQLPETPDDEHADRTTNLSDSGTSNAVKSDPDLDGPAASTASARRESWVPINNSPGMPPPSSDPDRRPSLPLPPRPMNSQSPFPLPSLHPDGPGPGAGPGPAPNPTSHLFTTTTSTSSSSPPSLPSLPSVSYPPSTSTTTPNHATGSGPAPTPRLQPLNSWMPRPAPPPTPYSQALPPINASTATIAPSSQQPLPSLRHQASPPIPSPLSPAIDLSVWSCSLVGEDVLAFLEGCGGEKAGSSGWLGAVWGSWK